MFPTKGMFILCLSIIMSSKWGVLLRKTVPTQGVFLRKPAPTKGVLLRKTLSSNGKGNRASLEAICITFVEV
jgi:hypothetical protein